MKEKITIPQILIKIKNKNNRQATIGTKFNIMTNMRKIRKIPLLNKIKIMIVFMKIKTKIKKINKKFKTIVHLVK